MRLAHRFMARAYTANFFLVILVPVILFSLFELIGQLDDVGKGGYELTDALTYVALTMPRRFVEMIPITAFMAGVITLGRLADSGELIALQACGFSFTTVAGAMIVTCGLIAISALSAEQTFIPTLEKKAAMLKARANPAKGLTWTEQGIWLRREGTFVNISSLTAQDLGEDIFVYHFDKEGRLEEFIHAKTAILGEKRWILSQVTTKEAFENGFITQRQETFIMDPLLSPEELQALELPPEGMSPEGLWHHAKALIKSGQNADHYLLIFWRKFSQPITAMTMTLLATALMFGQFHRGGMGRRLAGAVLAGLVFHFLDQITMQMGLLWGVPPMATAFMPATAILALALWRRTKVWA